MQAQAPPVQRLQFFLSESTWNAEAINQRRLQLLAADPATAATDQGVLVNWVEQSYKQTKDELGWANFMVRSDSAIRRHWILVYCAFSFCWWYDTNRVRVVDRSLQPTLLPVPSTGREKISGAIPCPCWAKAWRAVRAWVVPAHWLTRCWRAFANQPPPYEFNRVLQMLMKGDGINPYF